MYFLFKRESNGKPSKQFKNTKIPYVPSRSLCESLARTEPMFSSLYEMQIQFYKFTYFLGEKESLRLRDRGPL